MAVTQPNLFGGSKVVVQDPEPLTEVKVFRHSQKSRQVPLRQRRREALEKLMEVLEKLEGQTIYVDYCTGSRGHFWFTNLRLDRMRVEIPYWWKKVQDPNCSERYKELHSGAVVIVLWGNRGANIRIFTEQLSNVRIQEYFGYTSYLVDFWNGFASNPLNELRPYGYDCLHLIKFKD